MLKGDFSKLAKLQSQITQLANKATRTSLAKAMAAEALQLVQRGFREGVDPHGQRWAPLQHRNGKPLLDTGRLRSSFSAKPTSDGFEVGSNVTYAKFHQYGTGGRKKGSTSRRFVDKRGRFMSAAKAAKLQARANSAARLLGQISGLDGGSFDIGGRRARGQGRTETERAFLKTNRRLMRQASGPGFRFITHAEGSGALPARLMVPENGRLGSVWTQALDTVARNVFRKILRR